MFTLIVGSLLMLACKTKLNGLQTPSYLFPKDETHCKLYKITINV